MYATKQFNDSLLDYYISLVATKTKDFKNKYLDTAKKVLDVFDNRLVFSNTDNLLIDSVYSNTKKSFNDIYNKAYLKGGIVCDYLTLGTIKPSDLDYSISILDNDSNKSKFSKNVLKKICSDFNGIFQWMINLDINTDDYKDFVELFFENSLNNNEELLVYNSYNKTIYTYENISNIEIKYLNNEFSYSYTEINPKVIVIRFFLELKTSLDFKVKLNLVDLSIHLVKKIRYKNNFDPLIELNIHNNTIRSLNIYSLLEDQLSTYASNILRNDRKLEKRKNRVLNIIKTINNKTQPSNIHIPNTKNVCNWIVLNQDKFLNNVMGSNILYPYYRLPLFLCLKNIKITFKQFKPQYTEILIFLSKKLQNKINIEDMDEINKQVNTSYKIRKNELNDIYKILTDLFNHKNNEMNDLLGGVIDETDIRNKLKKIVLKSDHKYFKLIEKLKHKMNESEILFEAILTDDIIKIINDLFNLSDK